MRSDLRALSRIGAYAPLVIGLSRLLCCLSGQGCMCRPPTTVVFPPVLALCHTWFFRLAFMHALRYVFAYLPPYPAAGPLSWATWHMG